MREQPRWAQAAWCAIAFVIVLLAVHSFTQFGGEGVHRFLDDWLANAAEWVAAVMCLVAAVRKDHRRRRAIWMCFGLAIVAWAIGDTLWSVNGDPEALTSASDIFWLAWYPLVLAGLALLVRDRVPRFEFHRWVDGVVVMLLIATPWVALFLEPAADKSNASTFADVVDFTYPLLDAVVLGAVIGAIALTAWRPGRLWLLLAFGFGLLCIADSVWSLDTLARGYSAETGYDAVWLLGVTLVAFCAWMPRPAPLPVVEHVGWRAIALPVLAQLVALGIQVYGLFHHVPLGERVITIVVLAIAIVQIIATRPSPDTDPADAETLAL